MFTEHLLTDGEIASFNQTTLNIGTQTVNKLKYQNMYFPHILSANSKGICIDTYLKLGDGVSPLLVLVIMICTGFDTREEEDRQRNIKEDFRLCGHVPFAEIGASL